MTSVQDRSLEPAQQSAPPRRPTWREKRWQRRRRRRRVEEVLAWILVPAILLSGYALVTVVLNGMGTSPTAVVDSIKAFMSGAPKAP